MTTIGIGSKVWVADPFMWRTPTDEMRAQDPRVGYIEVPIVGETKVSWLLDGDIFSDWKVAKKPRSKHDTESTRYIVTDYYMGRNTTIYLTTEALDEAIWRQRHMYRLTSHFDRVARSLSNDVLRQVAKLIGYDENAPR